MSSDASWPLVPLRNVVDVVDFVANGSFASLKANVSYRNKADFAVLVRLVDFNSRWQGERVYVDEHAYRFLGKSSLEPGDVLVANVGANAGTVFRAPDLGQPMTLGPNAVALKPRELSQLDRRFVYYYLCGPAGQQAIRSVIAGSAQPKFNKTDLRGLPFPVPPMSTQERIVGTLAALDDKIELSRRMSRTLELTARAIFRSWFVEFDPVRAKREGGAAGVASDLSTFFPSKLATSEGRDVPSGWQLEPMGQHIEVARGLSYHGAGLSSQGLPMHNLNSVLEGGGYKFEGIKFYGGDYQPRHIARKGDVLVANTEQGHERRLIGFPALVPSVFGEVGIFSHHLFRVRPRADSPLSSAYLYHLLASNRTHEEVSGYATGTTVNSLPVDALTLPIVVVPPSQLIRAFDALATQVWRRCEQLYAESITLLRTRELLLPALLSNSAVRSNSLVRQQPEEAIE